MAENRMNDPMFAMYISETTEMIENLESIALASESTGVSESVDEIFRIMHTIKGSSAMMEVHNVSQLTHTFENLFHFIRENSTIQLDNTLVCDLMLQTVDFVKEELAKMQNGQAVDADNSELCQKIEAYLNNLNGNESNKVDKNTNQNNVKEKKLNKPQQKQNYTATIFFDDGCGMENIRAFEVIHRIEDKVNELTYEPADIMENQESAQTIVEQGFKIDFYSKERIKDIRTMLNDTMFLKELIVQKNPKREEAISQTKTITQKQNYTATIFFDDGCGMENIRAFEVIHRIEDKVNELTYEPADIMENQESAQTIVKQGFKIDFYSNQAVKDIRKMLGDTMFLKELIVHKKTDQNDQTSTDSMQSKAAPKNNPNQRVTQAVLKQSMISVNADKLDLLMNLMEELVISQTMVIQNPEFKTLKNQRLLKEAKQLGKITNELRDAVMEIRMVPLSITFQKMNRLVRDMGKKLGKKVTLVISGEQTEVDKNIIDKIADPLMHIIRNSVDHGIETIEERAQTDKDEMGKVYLSAENIGSNVVITVQDDGKGLDRHGILSKAREKGLIDKPEEELTDQEIYGFIFHPGFSTNKKVTEFSGRGVGMDVVNKNIKALNGMIAVDSALGKGTTMTIKIPLTIAIIDGMLVRVGQTVYTIPTMNIKECFKATTQDIIKDRYNNEMVLVRDECYKFARLDELFSKKKMATTIEDGIVVMIEYEKKVVCLLADRLIGRQQIVVKALPEYIKNTKGISGCTLLGDGSVSLIIDIPTVTK